MLVLVRVYVCLTGCNVSDGSTGDMLAGVMWAACAFACSDVSDDKRVTCHRLNNLTNCHGRRHRQTT